MALDIGLFEEGIVSLSLLFHVLLAFLEAIALALDVDDGAAMQNTVKNGRSDGNIGKDVVPLRKGFVGGKDMK